MKTTHPRIGLFFALMLLISAFTSHAHPYASGITNDNGTIRFVLNEAGGNVTVTYEDGSTNASYDGQTTGLGQPAGTNNSFALGAHSSFKIQVAYVGNGVAKQISSDAANNTGGYGAIRGIDVNKNPTNGNLFGRTYVGNGATLSVNVAPFNSHTKGVFAYNADLSDSPMAYGTNGQGSATWAASTSDPYRITVNNDGTLYLTAFSTADASLYSMSSDLTTVGLVLNPAFEQGQGLNFVHGDPQGVYTTGNIANGNLVVWTSDPAVNAPGYTNLTTLLPNTLGDITSPGDWNNVCRYDIGAGPLPWNQPPNYAVCLGLNNFYDSQNTEVTVTPDGKYVYGVFRRLNFSNGNLQCFDPVTAHLIYTSLHADGTDPWFAATGNQGLYAGVRVTPEGRFIVAGGINNTLIYTFLTNGIPDESTLTIIANTPTSTNARGLAVDAADNILATSSGTGLLRVWSLNYSTTAITGNDSTGTNGTFSIALPPVVATIATSRILGSQNYVNNTNGDVGAPIPAVITVGLSTNYLASPVTVTLATVTSGIQFVGTNASTATFLINTNATTNSDGVLFATTNQIVFPAGAQPRGTNWAFDIVITPATNPISGPTISFKETLISGAGYIIVPPIVQTVSLANTGPQVLTLGAAVPAAASMLRGVPGDYARFFITRTGDTNGPNGGASLHVPIFYTVTNFTFSGTSAGLGVDYTAGPQKAGALGTTIPQDNSPGGPFGSIAINPNETVITNIIGNPVYHTNIYQLPTNVTVIIALTNKVAPPSSTNLLSADSPSYPYQAALATTTITIVDNALAVEPKLLYSNPLTNALDSTNWTLTFLATNFNTVNAGWPLVMKNYSNTVPNDFAGSQTNNFIVQFGAPSTDPGFAYDIPKSPSCSPMAGATSCA